MAVFSMYGKLNKHTVLEYSGQTHITLTCVLKNYSNSSNCRRDWAGAVDTSDADGRVASSDEVQ